MVQAYAPLREKKVCASQGSRVLTGEDRIFDPHFNFTQSIDSANTYTDEIRLEAPRPGYIQSLRTGKAIELEDGLAFGLGSRGQIKLEAEWDDVIDRYLLTLKEGSASFWIDKIEIRQGRAGILHPGSVVETGNYKLKFSYGRPEHSEKSKEPNSINELIKTIIASTHTTTTNRSGSISFGFASPSVFVSKIPSAA